MGRLLYSYFLNLSYEQTDKMPYFNRRKIWPIAARLQFQYSFYWYKNEKLPSKNVRESRFLYLSNKHLIGVSQIKQWNGLRSDQLKAGSRLTIFTRNPQPQSLQNLSKTSNNIRHHLFANFSKNELLQWKSKWLGFWREPLIALIWLALLWPISEPWLI